MAVIGIDFGTAFSSVAGLIDGKICIFEDDQGKTRIPSCVSFLDDEIRIGSLAEMKKEENPKNTIYGVQKILGQSYPSSLKIKDKFKWPFMLIKAEGDKVKIEVSYQGSKQQFYPEEIASFIFHHLVQIAEKNLNTEISGAVISVPSGFNHAQRRAISDAATIANINLKELINESTAAAAYFTAIRWRKMGDIQKHIMLIQIGAGSFAVSIFRIRGLSVEVIVSEGNPFFGGEDITITLLQNLTYKLQSSEFSGGKFVEKNFVLLKKLCEKMKHDLSLPTIKRTKQEIPTTSFEITLTKDELLEASCTLCEMLKSTINRVFMKSSLKEKIDEVILIGGSTRLNWLSELLMDLKIQSKVCVTGVKTDESCVLGAAVVGYDFSIEGKFGLQIYDVLNYSIIDGNKTLLEKQTPLHTCKIKYEFYVPFIPRNVQLMDEYENILICFRKNFSQKHSFEMNVDKNGMIFIDDTVSLEVIDGIHGSEITELIARLEKLRESHAEREHIGKVKYHLEKDTLNAKKILKKVLKGCDRTENWIENNPASNLDDVISQREELQKTMNLLHAILPDTQTAKKKEFCKNLSDIRSQIQQSMKESLSKRDKEISFLQKENDELTAMIKTRDSSILAMKAEINDKWEQRESEFSDQLRRKDEKIEELENMNVKEKNKREKLRIEKSAEIEELKKRELEFSNQILRKDERIKELENKNAEEKNKRERLRIEKNAEIEELKARESEFSDKIRRKDERIEELEKLQNKNIKERERRERFRTEKSAEFEELKRKNDEDHLNLIERLARNNSEVDKLSEKCESMQVDEITDKFSKIKIQENLACGGAFKEEPNFSQKRFRHLEQFLIHLEVEVSNCRKVGEKQLKENKDLRKQLLNIEKKLKQEIELGNSQVLSENDRMSRRPITITTTTPMELKVVSEVKTRAPSRGRHGKKINSANFGFLPGNRNGPEKSSGNCKSTPSSSNKSRRTFCW